MKRKRKQKTRIAKARPRPGFDNVAFKDGRRRIVGTVINYDDDGRLMVLNPFLDDMWHVPVNKATIVNEEITGAPKR